MGGGYYTNLFSHVRSYVKQQAVAWQLKKIMANQDFVLSAEDILRQNIQKLEDKCNDFATDFCDR